MTYVFEEDQHAKPCQLALDKPGLSSIRHIRSLVHYSKDLQWNKDTENYTINQNKGHISRDHQQAYYLNSCKYILKGSANICENSVLQFCITTTGI